jgi:hypothetical protein
MRHVPYNNCWSEYKYQDRNLKIQNDFKEKMTQQRKYTMQSELEKFVLPYCLLDYSEVVYKIDSLKT